MGLDMFLRGKRICYNDGEKIQQLFPELEGKVDNFGGPVIRGIEIEAGYWRKANAIHRWFVNNVQDGRDECQSTHVDREHLATLRKLCNLVLADHSLAQQLLPTQEGFFFGGTEYDEGYFDDLENTIKIIDAALTLPDNWYFEYRASW